MNAVLKYDILENNKDYDYQEDTFMVEPLCKLSVYDLGGTEHSVSLTRNKKFGFHLEIANEEEQISYQETELHPYALESMASFCRRFLNCYDNTIDDEPTHVLRGAF